MSRRIIKTAVMIMMAAILLVGSLAGTGCTTEEEGTIYLPLLIPYSGPYASGYESVNWTAKAIIKYINEEDPIPGVTLELLVRDSKGDSAEANPGYQYLKGQGAKFIAVTDTTTAVTLKNTLDTDKFPAFMLSGTSVATANPGYVFCIPMTYYNQVQPLMEYIMDTWDYTGTGRNPNVGIFGWANPYGTDRQDGIEDYIADNPGQFDYAGAQMVSPTATGSFATQADNLQDCDYVFIGAPANAAAPFMNTMRTSGYTDPVFCILGSDTGFMSTYVTMPGKEGFNGTLWASDAGYYATDSDEISVLGKKLLDEYFTAADKAAFEESQQAGLTTLVWSLLVPIEALREAVKDLDDPTDVTGEMIYDAATTITFSYEGFPDSSYSATKRALLTKEKIYEYNAADNTWIAVSDWITAPTYAE